MTNRELFALEALQPVVLTAGEFLGMLTAREGADSHNVISQVPMVVTGTVIIDADLITLPAVTGENPGTKTQSIKYVTFEGLVIVNGMKRRNLSFFMCSFRKTVYFEYNYAERFSLRLRDCKFGKSLRFFATKLSMFEIVRCSVRKDLDLSRLVLSNDAESVIHDVVRQTIIWGEGGPKKQFKNIHADPRLKHVQQLLGL